MAYSEKEEIRSDISLLNSLMNLEIDGYDISRQQHLKSVADFKRYVRKKLAKFNNRTDERHYSEDGESYYYKEWFDEAFTEEEKQEYIKANWQSINNFPWSPTGQWFTRDIIICNVNTSFGAKAVAYTFMGLDC